MSKLLRIQLPIRTYLKKYIAYIEEAPLVINRATPFRRYVFAMLEKDHVIRDANYVPTWLKADRVTDNLTIFVTERTFSHVGNTVSNEKAMYINSFLLDQFGTAMTLAAMNQHFRHGTSLKRGVEIFAEAHSIEIEVDVTMDNLLKILHRVLRTLEPKSHQNITNPLLLPYDPVEQLILFDLPADPSELEKNVTKILKKPQPPIEGPNYQQLDIFG